jgi:membrane protease YdiL (CAAX protease family)
MTEIRAYFDRSSDLVTSLVLVVPLLLVYNLGLVLTDWTALNGADVVTVTLVQWAGFRGYSIFQAALALFFIGAIAWLQKRRRFQWADYWPLLVESSVYAVSMGSLILLIMAEASLLGPDARARTWVEIVTVSAGAGVYEELLFRLLLIPALAWLTAQMFKISLGASLAVGVALSSVVFSAAHYFGPEPFAFFTFAYRTLAGLVFSLLYLFRGFAVAVYTHFLYDVYVMLSQQG